jgi:hypothetical protein
MSYHRPMGALPDFASTQMFAEAVDPYSQRFSPPGAIFSPYGWGPDFNIGMPFNYTHHIDYVRTPVPGARRIGPMYDELSPYRTGTALGAAPAGKLVEWVNRQVANQLPVGGAMWRVEEHRPPGRTPEIMVRVPAKYAMRVRQHLPWMLRGRRIIVTSRGSRIVAQNPPAHIHVITTAKNGSMSGSWSGSAPGYEASHDSLGGILAVL